MLVTVQADGISKIHGVDAVQAGNSNIFCAVLAEISVNACGCCDKSLTLEYIGLANSN